ncbi:MAG: TlpA family protein disulfide reductase [Acidobacteria bacterium]|nr:TlpA family protein disulfide reductase [Acidobacteriota bacterium]
MKFALILAAAALSFAAEPLQKINEIGYPKMLAAQKGKVVLVDFWATWCVPCRKELPELAKLEARLKAKGLVLVPISADEPENADTAREFLAKAGVTGATYLKAPKDDDVFIRLIDPKWGGELPALVLYDKAGRKVQLWKGETSVATIEAAVGKLL